MLLLATENEWVAINPENGAELCRSRASRDVQELAPDPKGGMHVVPLEADQPGYAFLHNPEGAAGLLDLRTGVLRWKRRVPLQTVPEIGLGRVVYYIGGHGFTLDEKTGATLLDATRVAQTYWESVTRDGENLVAADENGNIVTLSMLDGCVLCAQQEKGAGFRFATVLGDRLFLQGTEDGALWVYERNPRFGTTSRGRGRAAPATKRTAASRAKSRPGAAGSAKRKTADQTGRRKGRR